MDLHYLKKEISCNLTNILEAEKLPESKQRDSYIRKTKAETEQLVRKIGRTISYVKLNKDAYKQGLEWLSQEDLPLELYDMLI